MGVGLSVYMPDGSTYDGYMMIWPASQPELSRLQATLAATSPDPWHPPTDKLAIGGVFVCFGRGGSGPGEAGDAGWVGAAVVQEGRIIAKASVTGAAGGAYRSGYLALREGLLLEKGVRALGAAPDVLLVNATGRDHPRRAGLALHLGAALEVPTIGVTHKALAAQGGWPPADDREATAPLVLDEELVGYWVRTRGGCRPLAAHAAWRTSPDTARTVILAAAGSSRTPEPLREARRLARTARSGTDA